MIDETTNPEDSSDPAGSSSDAPAPESVSVDSGEPSVDSGSDENSSASEVAAAEVEAGEVDSGGVDSGGVESGESAVDVEEELDTEIHDDDLADPDDDDDQYGGDENAKPIEESDGSQPDPEDEAEERPSSGGKMDWYILKVQSNREKSICAGLKRRVAMQGLDEYFGDIMVPTEDVAEFKNGKRRVVKRKLYPGYIVAHMVLNDETWFLVRETSGIGDFTGAAGKPTPMLKEEVDRIVKAANPEEDDSEQIKTAIPFTAGDRVRIKEGTFENFEGDVEGIDEANGRVTVTINIFGRSTPVELEHWQIEAV